MASRKSQNKGGHLAMATASTAAYPGKRESRKVRISGRLRAIATPRPSMQTGQAVAVYLSFGTLCSVWPVKDRRFPVESFHDPTNFRKLHTQFVQAAAKYEPEGYELFIERGARSEQDHVRQARCDIVGWIHWPYKPWRTCAIFVPYSSSQQKPFSVLKKLATKAWLWLPAVVRQGVMCTAEKHLAGRSEFGLSWARWDYQLWVWLLWFDWLRRYKDAEPEEPQVPSAGMDLRPFSSSASLIERWGLDSAIPTIPNWLKDERWLRDVTAGSVPPVEDQVGGRSLPAEPSMLRKLDEPIGDLGGKTTEQPAATAPAKRRDEKKPAAASPVEENPLAETEHGRADVGDTIVVKTGKKKRNRTKVTDDQIEAEIRAYVARNEVAYNRFKKARAEHQPKSEKHARAMFGRNKLTSEVGKALGQRISGSRISPTAAWANIKKELLLDDTPGGNHRGQKIGLEIAVEQAAERTGDTTKKAVLDRELIERIEKELPEGTASDLISRYQLGEINEEDIEDILIANADHKAKPPEMIDSDRRRPGLRRRLRHD